MVYWILDLRLVLGDTVNYEQAAMCKYLGEIPKLYYITSLHYYDLYNLYIFTVNNRKLWNIPKSIFHLSVRPVVRSSKSFVRKERGWGPPILPTGGWFKLRICISLEVNGLQIMIMNGMTIMMVIKFMVVASIMMIATMRVSLTTIEIRCVFQKVFVNIFKERFERQKRQKHVSTWQIFNFFNYSTFAFESQIVCHWKGC